MKYYRCKHCGNLLAVINDGGVTPVCCGDSMNSEEGATVEQK